VCSEILDEQSKMVPPPPPPPFVSISRPVRLRKIRRGFNIVGGFVNPKTQRALAKVRARGDHRPRNRSAGPVFQGVRAVSLKKRARQNVMYGPRQQGRETRRKAEKHPKAVSWIGDWSASRVLRNFYPKELSGRHETKRVAAGGARLAYHPAVRMMDERSARWLRINPHGAGYRPNLLNIWNADARTVRSFKPIRSRGGVSVRIKFRGDDAFARGIRDVDIDSACGPRRPRRSFARTRVTENTGRRYRANDRRYQW